jgi:uncharacterized membrane protein YdfJ with MMPL/SSD domain
MFTVQVEQIFNTVEGVARTALVGVGRRGAQRPVLCVETKPGTEAAAVTSRLRALGTVTGAFTFAPLTPMRLLGLGMIIALLIDATLVRMLLVPALVELMGRANWWMPGTGGPPRASTMVTERVEEPVRTLS